MLPALTDARPSSTADPSTARSNAVCPRPNNSKRRLFVPDRQHHLGEVLAASERYAAGLRCPAPVRRALLPFKRQSTPCSPLPHGIKCTVTITPNGIPVIWCVSSSESMVLL